MDDKDNFADLLKTAIEAVEKLNDWASCNETYFTGWGDMTIPPKATFWRVKSGQALENLKELIQ